MTTNWREERDDAWADLGGRRPEEEPSLESKRAMVRAGLGNKALARNVGRTDALEEYSRRHLSGVAERTPEQDIALFDLAEAARDDADERKIADGADPTQVAAQRHARDERKLRPY